MTVHWPFETESLRGLAVALLHARCEAAEGRPAVALDDWPRAVAALRAAPIASEARLVAVADTFGLEDFELVAAALCLAADNDPLVARAVARAQDPIGGSRPLIGMLTAILTPLGATPLSLAGGMAVQAGLLKLADECAALPERSIALPLAVAAALVGCYAPPDRIEALVNLPTPLPPGQNLRCDEEARWLELGDANRMLLVRGSCDREVTAVISRIAAASARRAVAIEPGMIAANAAWLVASASLPCVRFKLGPGETGVLASTGRYCGPVLILAGHEGIIETTGPLHEWTLAVPEEDERVSLWIAAGFDSVAAERAGQSYRQGAGRIAELAERVGPAPDWSALVAAVGASRTRLDGLARRSHARYAREDLVLPPASLAELDRLVGRIRQRNRLGDNLGPAITARYRPGVRGLFTGESGTGKTLAAHWLAHETGLPLYRVDQAALTSKWIGETEKNLSAILDAAQHADVVLFFDEADAMFGARTDVRDSNDRHANAQTNYLLQRIEDYEGIIILATNSRDRFDPAFVRRLDAILAFPMPDARARQALWHVHLGTRHSVTEDEIGRLAVSIDLAGGHIRNIVLGAAVRARLADRDIQLADIAAATGDEYAKLGRAAPSLAP